MSEWHPSPSFLAPTHAHPWPQEDTVGEGPKLPDPHMGVRAATGTGRSSCLDLSPLQSVLRALRGQPSLSPWPLAASGLGLPPHQGTTFLPTGPSLTLRQVSVAARAQLTTISLACFFPCPVSC